MVLPFIKKKMDSVASVLTVPPVAMSYTESGIEFPYSVQPKTENEFYWQSLEQEGLADIVNGHYVLPWDEFYNLQADEDHKACLALWDIPETTNLRPIIRSEGALSDVDFQIILEGWHDQAGTKQTSVIKRTGAILTRNGQAQLLSKQTWKLVEKIREFSRISANKTEHDNKHYWAKIRRLAQQSDSRMDDFLRKTIVLAPDTLKLDMRRNQQLQDTLIEVQPSFENAPKSWLDTFDRYSDVQTQYNLPLEDGGIVHVLISPEVKTVLDEIKQMDHRRVTGERARAFLHNPYAQLGDDAAKVIPPETFEKAKEDAEIYSYDLTITTSYDENKLFEHAELRLDGRSQKESDPIFLELNNIVQAAIFIETYKRSQSESINSLYWAGYEIILSSPTQKQIEQLKSDLDSLLESAHRQQIDQILNLDNYSNRVVDIGAAPVLNSQYMQRDSGEADWLPDHIADLFPSFKEHESLELLSNIQSQIDEAEALGQSVVQLPYLEQPVSIEDAKAIAQQLDKNLKSINSHESEQAPQESPAPKQERSVLIIDSNIEEIDFTSQRASQLEFNENIHKAVLPNSLRSDVVLKDHQKVGVAWLQNLYKFAPDQISGCLLADDMGLGKTLQLLCFIGTYLETTPNKRPILIVAPVSLLENWEAEAIRFFSGKFGSILKLYGENLKVRKLKKHQVPAALLDKGISNLLCEGWRDQHDIVLTTYETLRDLEFSLAREHWSIMICDEAQKIKVPNTLATQAAKAQKVDFKIACTGTPVENSLTDLWCLFDFIQAGLLGSLNQFGRDYRRPIEQISGADATALEELRRLIQPQILRRTKQEVAKDLPAKIESTDCKQLPISKLQQRLYAQIAQEYRNISDDKRGQAILGALHKMRMVCAHPFYLEPIAHRQESPKIAWLINTLKNIQAKNEKVIIFTEFREIQSFLQKILMEVFGFNVTTVNGDTSASSEKGGMSRQRLIDAFQRKDGFNIIILSTTAVGFGVNVQAANHVIHYTRCWNPAKEDQATDRAYRIGQTRDVSVYYPTIHASEFDTFEIKLDRLLSSKRQLAGDMLNGSGEISAKELAEDVFR